MKAGRYSVYNRSDSLQAMIISGCITSATISAALPFGHLIIGTVPKKAVNPSNKILNCTLKNIHLFFDNTLHIATNSVTEHER